MHILIDPDFLFSRTSIISLTILSSNLGKNRTTQHTQICKHVTFSYVHITELNSPVIITFNGLDQSKT